MPGRGVRIGRILRPQGKAGEVKVEPWLTPLDKYLGLREVLAEGNEGQGRPYAVEAGRLMGGAVILKLRGVASIEQAEALRGQFLSAEREDLPPLPEGDYYWEDLEGLEVFDEGGACLGKIKGAFPTGSNDVLIIEGEQEVLLPALKEVILEVDPEGGRMVVRLPEGLLNDA